MLNFWKRPFVMAFVAGNIVALTPALQAQPATAKTASHHAQSQNWSQTELRGAVTSNDGQARITIRTPDERRYSLKGIHPNFILAGKLISVDLANAKYLDKSARKVAPHELPVNDQVLVKGRFAKQGAASEAARIFKARSVRELGVPSNEHQNIPPSSTDNTKADNPKASGSTEHQNIRLSNSDNGKVIKTKVGDVINIFLDVPVDVAAANDACRWSPIRVSGSQLQFQPSGMFTLMRGVTAAKILSSAPGTVTVSSEKSDCQNSPKGNWQVTVEITP